ncbi:hypothetical protein B0H16DRAFT_1791989 [Mycena metata]|uniref:Uncharacterized protein n=1 Tax=Mycena metata TaxID=1033252 RepID=A0AAD7HHN3_9AGAR|nr:hypothetical protein B0H16DRAFT_1791989 [Mycena metata]
MFDEAKTFESVTTQVAWCTPLAKLNALEAAVNTWLSTEQNQWFVSSTSITLQHIDFQRYLEFTVSGTTVRDRTRQDWGLRSARKTVFHAAVQHYCRELGIVRYVAAAHRLGRPEPRTAPYPPVTSPTSATPVSPDDLDADADAQGEVAPTAKLAPVLGFTPPRSIVYARGRKAALRAAGGGSDI